MNCIIFFKFLVMELIAFFALIDFKGGRERGEILACKTTYFENKYKREFPQGRND